VKLDTKKGILIIMTEVPDYAELLQELAAQENELQFSAFTNEAALAIGLQLIEAATAGAAAVTIDICRHGQQLFHYAMPGTSVDNDEWIKRKNRVVDRFGHSSYYMGIYYKERQTTIQEKSFLNPTDYAAHGGAFPIIIKGVGPIGTVTVSGLPQAEDHRLVVQVLRDFLSSQPKMR
jgi:uncharacterized protein (UPF0303 family)